MACSLNPYIVLPGVSIARAAASSAVLGVIRVGFGVILSVIFVCIIHMYRVFDDKIQEDKATDRK